MIIIRYPGVGGRHMAKVRDNVIDLDINTFNEADASQLSDWYKYYCKIAIDLSDQGNTVFVPNDIDVIAQLINVNYKDIAFVFPSLQIRDGWLKRLKYIFESNNVSYNKYVYNRARIMYMTDITDLINLVSQNNFRYWCIDGEFNLPDIIEKLKHNQSSNNIEECNKVCGMCSNFIGGGDYNLCCKLNPNLIYEFDKPCQKYALKTTENE